ncbi:hypothetical protein ACJX0J_036653, partial [Zea mays]
LASREESEDSNPDVGRLVALVAVRHWNFTFLGSVHDTELQALLSGQLQRSNMLTTVRSFSEPFATIPYLYSESSLQDVLRFDVFLCSLLLLLKHVSKTSIILAHLKYIEISIKKENNILYLYFVIMGTRLSTGTAFQLTLKIVLRVQQPRKNWRQYCNWYSCDCILDWIVNMKNEAIHRLNVFIDIHLFVPRRSFPLY